MEIVKLWLAYLVAKLGFWLLIGILLVIWFGLVNLFSYIQRIVDTRRENNKKAILQVILQIPIGLVIVCISIVLLIVGIAFF